MPDPALMTVTTSPESGVAGQPLADAAIRDAVLAADLALIEGDDGDQFGFYVRQSTDERYLAITMSIAGRCLVIEKDAQVVARVDAPLNPDVPFRRGLGATNRFAVVLAGPALVLYLNHAPITPLLVDQRFFEGIAGFYVRPGGTSPSVVLEVRSATVVPITT